MTAVTAVLCAPAVAGVSAAAPPPVTRPGVPRDATGAHVGGPLLADATWTAADGPYIVDEPVQVADGVTLRIEPGTQVLAAPGADPPGSGTLLQVAGTLEAQGTEQSPVMFDGGTPAGHAYGLVGPVNSATDALVELSHVDVRDFDALAPPAGGGGHADYSIVDSTFTNLPEMSYFWYPPSFATVQRNVFVNVGTLSFGTDQHAVATVTNNRFRGMSSRATRQTAVESWAAYGQPLQLHANTFEPVDGQPAAVAVTTDGVIDASGNDWSTTDSATIEGRVLDRLDDLNRPSVINVDSPLGAPDPATPTIVPTAPRALSLTRGDKSLSVTWQPPLSDGGAAVWGYTVTAVPQTLPGDTVEVSLAPSDGWTQVRGLVNGTKYVVLVSADNPVGSSVLARSEAVAPAGLPGRPGRPVAQVVGRGVSLSWAAAAPNGARVTSYRVYAVSGPSRSSVTTTQRRAAVRHLRPGTYVFVVAATNGVGAGQASRSVRVHISPARAAGR